MTKAVNSPLFKFFVPCLIVQIPHLTPELSTLKIFPLRVLRALLFLQWFGRERELCSRPETDTSYSLWFLIVAGIAGVEPRVGASMFSCGKRISISYWIQVLKGNPWSFLYFNISQKRNGNELCFQMFSQSVTRGDKVYILCWNIVTFFTNESLIWWLLMFG